MTSWPVVVVRMVGAAVAAWWNHNSLRLGASVAYYTLFAIAPILLIAIAVAGSVFGDEAVRGEVVGQVDGLIGRDGGAAVQALLQGAVNDDRNALAAIVGTLASLLAACGVFLELQAALNTVWNVAPASGGFVRSFFLDRARSLGLIVAVGFLLLVSLTASAALAAAAAWLGRWAPAVPVLVGVVNWLTSTAVTGVLFALLFKFLPALRLPWEPVLVGGAVTAVLFTMGQFLIGLYLGHSGAASSYGAAGSVIVLLLWVYYSAQILLIGAEFTKLYAERQPALASALLATDAKSTKEDV